MSWESVVQEKLASRAASISAILPRLDNGQDDENNPLSKGEEDITTLSSKIAKGEITAEILTRAAIRRLVLPHKPGFSVVYMGLSAVI